MKFRGACGRERSQGVVGQADPVIGDFDPPASVGRKKTTRDHRSAAVPDGVVEQAAAEQVEKDAVGVSDPGPAHMEVDGCFAGGIGEARGKLVRQRREGDLGRARS